MNPTFSTLHLWVMGRPGLPEKNSVAGIIIAVSAALCACSDSDKTVPASEANRFDSPVLATVNGQAITELDLELAIDRTLGGEALFQINSEASRKVLESLVMSKSLAIKKQAELSPEELNSIERQVQAYRDELLAKQYLKENITATPVTDGMVKAYYEQHPDKFGGTTKKQYELIKAKDPIGSAERAKMLAAFQKARQESDWKAFTRQLTSEKLPVAYSQGAVARGTMAAEFENVIKPLREGEVSDVFFMRKMPAIVRVIQVIPATPKPLAEVSGEIRKQLAPIQLRKAIKESAAAVMETMTIEYK